MRPYRIAVVGVESSGKTTLSYDLSKYYKTGLVPEYARIYLRQNTEYDISDLENIAVGQVEMENNAARQHKKLIICDTNLLVIKLWSEYKYNRCPEVILNLYSKYQYDLTILTEPDFPWVEDPLRENPSPIERSEIHNLYKTELYRMKANYIVVGGTPGQRLNKTIAAIDRILLQ